MPKLEKIARLFDRINELTGHAISWLTMGMVAVTFAVVLMRYLFNSGWIAMQESITFMHALVFMLGAAYTLKHDGHVRVDIFYRNFSPRKRALVDLLGFTFFLIPVTCFIFLISWEYVISSWALMEGSREAGGLPGIFLLKSVLLLMPALLLLQGVSQAIRSLQLLFDPPPVQKPGEPQ